MPVRFEIVEVSVGGAERQLYEQEVEDVPAGLKWGIGTTVNVYLAENKQIEGPWIVCDVDVTSCRLVSNNPDTDVSFWIRQVTE